MESSHRVSTQCFAIDQFVVDIILKIIPAGAECLEARGRAQAVHKKSVKEKILCLLLRIFSFTD
jgi:hypothetical protein